MDEYPTEEELETIRTWKGDDLHGMMKYIYDLWKYAEYGYWKEENGEYYLSTGGWSGNEDILTAIQSNHVWWMFFWLSSKRGGQYIFSKGRE